jgi:cytochrome b6-f complex iron-sulfur subunit
LLYDSDANNYSIMDRRLLIQRVLMGTTALVLMPGILTSCEKSDYNPDDKVPLGPDIKNDIKIDITQSEYAVLANAGGSKVVSGIIVVNTGTNGYVALSASCTHAGTQINYSSASNNLQCPSHGSVFSLTGSVIEGPAVLALKTYTVSKSGNILTIKE